MSAYRNHAIPTLDELCAAVRRADVAEWSQRNVWHAAYDARTAASEAWNFARGAFATAAFVVLVIVAAVIVRGGPFVAIALLLAIMGALWGHVGRAYGERTLAQARCADEWRRLKQREDEGARARRALAATYTNSTALTERTETP